MLDWLKTPSGAYNLTLIVAVIAWLITGVGIFAGFHLNKVRTIEAEAKAQKAEKARTEMAAQLEVAHAKTAELEQRLAPRQLAPEQRKQFIAALADAPKGQLTIAYSNPQPETTAFVAQIRSLVVEAGYDVPSPSEYALGYMVSAPAPWFISMVAVPGTEPAYAQSIHRAFQLIGVDASGTDGTQIAKRGELKIYVGSK